MKKSLTYYQETGFESTAGRTQRDALREANERISEAARATPEQYRIEFKSAVQWAGDGYGWEWVLR